MEASNFVIRITQIPVMTVEPWDVAEGRTATFALIASATHVLISMKQILLVQTHALLV